MFAHALAGHHTFDFLKVLQISSFSWNFVKGVGPADDLGMAKEENNHNLETICCLLCKLTSSFLKILLAGDLGMAEINPTLLTFL